jgi:hypothetical protein
MCGGHCSRTVQFLQKRGDQNVEIEVRLSRRLPRWYNGSSNNGSSQCRPWRRDSDARSSVDSRRCRRRHRPGNNGVRRSSRNCPSRCRCRCSSNRQSSLPRHGRRRRASRSHRGRRSSQSRGSSSNGGSGCLSRVRVVVLHRAQICVPANADHLSAEGTDRAQREGRGAGSRPC